MKKHLEQRMDRNQKSYFIAALVKIRFRCCVKVQSILQKKKQNHVFPWKLKLLLLMMLLLLLVAKSQKLNGPLGNTKCSKFLLEMFLFCFKRGQFISVFKVFRQKQYLWLVPGLEREKEMFIYNPKQKIR